MAVVGVHHNKVVTIPDDPNYPVGSDEWNDNHVVTGLENVDNTSDANKPVSTAQAAANAVVAANASAADAVVAANAANASNLTSGTVPAARLPNPSATTLGGVESIAAVLHKWVDSISTSGVPNLSQPAVADVTGAAPLASPALTGVPTAPTAAANTNTTQIATTAYADAINTAVTASLALKAPLASPAFTGSATATSLSIAGATDLLTYDTKAHAVAATIPAIAQSIRLAGFYAAGDGGDGIFKRIGSLGSGKFGFQSADGAWWQLTANAGQLSARAFGAKCDAASGATDDSVAMQAAINHCQSATEATCLVIPGGCTISATMSITASIKIRGPIAQFDGFYMTAGNTVLSVNTPDPVFFESFCIRYQTVTATTGTRAILVQSPTTYNSSSRFIDLQISGCYNGIQFVNAAYWRMVGCSFGLVLHDGVVVQNSYQVDAGDSVITGCTFTGTVRANIDYISSSGLRVEHNKMIGGTYGVLMEWLGTQSIDSTTNKPGADLFIIGNSIECGAGGGSIVLTRTDSSAFGNVIVSGNELTGQYGFLVGASAAVWMFSVVCTNNDWDTSLLVPTAGVAFQLSSVKGAVVANNVVNGNSGSSNQIVNIAASCDSITVGPNRGFGASLVASSILSTNTIVLDVDAWTAYTPTVTASTGTFTTVSATGAYTVFNKKVTVRAAVTITTIGTAGGNLRITLPVNVKGGVTGQGVLIVQGSRKVGGVFAGIATAGSADCALYDGTFPGTSGDVVWLTVEYEAA